MKVISTDRPALVIINNIRNAVVLTLCRCLLHIPTNLIHDVGAVFFRSIRRVCVVPAIVELRFTHSLRFTCRTTGLPHERHIWGISKIEVLLRIRGVIIQWFSNWGSRPLEGCLAISGAVP